MKKIIIAVFALALFSSQSLRAEMKPYVYGGVKYFNYGISSSDLQAFNRAFISIGYTSSRSSTDNDGFGFELGVGIDVAPHIALEASYVDLGTLTIKTTTTGPIESFNTDIDGNSLTLGIVAKSETNTDRYFYGKAGMHQWDLDGKITGSRGTAAFTLGDGTDWFAGVGYRAGLFSVGYDYYKVDDGDISSITLSLVHNF
jgi:hypothetical protein